MKEQLRLPATLTLCLAMVSAFAQFGPPRGGMAGGPKGPKLSGSTAKLFGNNSAFSANLEFQTQDKSGKGKITMPGRIAFAEGKSRFEMDMTKMKGGDMPPEAAAQMKGMGMDRMVMISRPDKKVTYTVYPGLQAYVEMPLRDSDAAEAQSDFKVETAELGKETVDGHPCVKNRAVVTDKEGRKHESLVWNATDLKNFPIRIEQTEQDTTMTMLFKEIELSEPDVSLFDPPTDFKHYESMPALMQQEMMKRMGGGAGFPRRK